MVYKRFRAILVLRVLLLILSIGLFFILLFKSQLFAALFITGFTNFEIRAYSRTRVRPISCIQWQANMVLRLGS